MSRRILLWLLFFLFAWLLIARFAEISNLAATFARGRWEWVAVSAALMSIYFVAYATLYQVAFETVRVHRRIRDLLPLVFSSIFLNVAVPAGGTSGVALFIDDAGRHGQSPGRTAAGVLLVLTVDFCAFAVLLGLGLTYLATRRELRIYELSAASILLLLIACLATAFLLGLWRSWLLLRMLRRVQLLVNAVARVFKRSELLPSDWAARNAMDFSAASIAIAAHPTRLCGAFVVALSAHLINLASLYALLLAFHGPIHLGALVAGYAMGNLFWIVSFTPQGVGVVESVMTLAFVSLGVPIASSAAIVLCYRGFTFWLPLVAGFFSLRGLRSFRTTQLVGETVCSKEPVAP